MIATRPGLRFEVIEGFERVTVVAEIAVHGRFDGGRQAGEGVAPPVIIHGIRRPDAEMRNAAIRAGKITHVVPSCDDVMGTKIEQTI
jgi:hypothetical protein